MWDREEDFVKLLDKGIQKGTKGSIHDVVAMAVAEEIWGYKHVVGLLKRAMTKGKKDRITVFYIISNICRSSRSQMGSKDKYTQRFLPLLPSIAKLLAEAPADALVQAEKVLQTWRRDAAFPSAAISEFEEILRKGRAEAASRSQKRKVEQATVLAPPATIDVGIDFGSTLEDDTFPPPLDAAPFSGMPSSPVLPGPPGPEPSAKKARTSRWGKPVPPAPQPPPHAPPSAGPQHASSSQTTPAAAPPRPTKFRPPIQPPTSMPQQQLSFAAPGSVSGHLSSSGPALKKAAAASGQAVDMEDALRRVRDITAKFEANALPPKQKTKTAAAPGGAGDPSGPAAGNPAAASSQPAVKVDVEDAVRRVQEIAAKFAANNEIAESQQNLASAHANSAASAGLPPLPPPPPQPPSGGWAGLPAASALQPSPGSIVPGLPSHAPPPPQPVPTPGPPLAIPGPRPPPGSPPRLVMGPPQPPVHPFFPQPPLPVPPPAPPAAPHPQIVWAGAHSAGQHPTASVNPGPRPPPIPPFLPPQEFPSAASGAPPLPPDDPGATSKQLQSSSDEVQAAPPPPPSPPNGAAAVKEEAAAEVAHAAPRDSTVSSEAKAHVPGLENGADKANDEEWWTAVTSTLPNLDGVMSPS